MFYKFAIDMIFDVFSNLDVQALQTKNIYISSFLRDNYGLPGSRKPNPDPKTQSYPVLVRIRNTAPITKVENPCCWVLLLPNRGGSGKKICGNGKRDYR
jgi:hypothetical protein